MLHSSNMNTCSHTTLGLKPAGALTRTTTVRHRLNGLRCAAENRDAVGTPPDSPTTSSNEGRRAGGLGLSFPGFQLGLLSNRLQEVPTTAPSTSSYAREDRNSIVNRRSAAAAERIRALAKEVNDVSVGAQTLRRTGTDSQVSELRSKLQAIEDELHKLNDNASSAGIGSGRHLTLLNFPSLATAEVPVAVVEAPEAFVETPVTPSRRFETEVEAYVPVVEPPPPPVREVVEEVRPPTIPSAPVRIVTDKDVKPEGTGHEVLLQAFNWESHKSTWWQVVESQAEWFASLGISVVWLPPPTDSVSAEGYLPRDLYCLQSKYGSEDELRRCVRKLQSVGIKVLGDAVLNHRCANFQDENGVWNKFGGKMAWDQRAIVGDDPNFGGRGNKSEGDFFHAAPNIDHSQEFVRRDICGWLNWLKSNIGFDGWRLDFVRGFSGNAVGEYMAASTPTFAVGEFWDTLAYNWEGVPEHNQDAHRQRIVNWINAAGGRATAFDVTTKGILHAVFERCEYWRLRDKEGKPPGVMGWWPSRAVTFLENHDTGSTQGHWRFPHHSLEQGYAYIMTHPGTPSVFYDHLLEKQLENVIRQLIDLRKRLGINCRSKVKIVKAERDLYVAEVDEVLTVKLGPGDYPVDGGLWEKVAAGNCWSCWQRK